MMIAIEATLTASRKEAKANELLIFFTKGFNNATNINDGIKTPAVEIKAPLNPFI